MCTPPFVDDHPSGVAQPKGDIVDNDLAQPKGDPVKKRAEHVKKSDRPRPHPSPHWPH